MGRSFYGHDARSVARAVLGKLLVRRCDNIFLIARVVESEAYLGENDRASHAFRGKTARNQTMFGPPGFAYVYFTYGMHWMFNVVTGENGAASAVLARAAEPLAPKKSIEKRITSGPAKLTNWLKLTGSQNGVDLTTSNEIFLANKIIVDGESFTCLDTDSKEIISATRIGVESAEGDKNLPYRFYIKDSKWVSKR